MCSYQVQAVPSASRTWYTQCTKRLKELDMECRAPVDPIKSSSAFKWNKGIITERPDRQEVTCNLVISFSSRKHGAYFQGSPCLEALNLITRLESGTQTNPLWFLLYVAIRGFLTNIWPARAQIGGQLFFFVCLFFFKPTQLSVTMLATVCTSFCPRAVLPFTLTCTLFIRIQWP